MSYDQFDQWASWVPECNGVYSAPYIREPDPVQDYTPQPRYAYDGGESPVAIVNPTPMKSIEPWDSATQELRITLTRHPVAPKFLQDTFKAAIKNYGTVKSMAVFVCRGLGDSQSIHVLRSMGFAKDEARGTGQGVCYTRDMRKQEPKPKPEPLESKPEQKPLDWCERELQITTDAIESRRALGVHETFLTGLLSEQADQQKMVDERDAVRESPEMLELIRQEAEVAAEIARLQAQKEEKR